MAGESDNCKIESERLSERSRESSGWGSPDMDGKAGGWARWEVSESNPVVIPQRNHHGILRLRCAALRMTLLQILTLRLLVCYFAPGGKHRSNSSSETKIQRHEPDR